MHVIMEQFTHSDIVLLLIKTQMKPTVNPTLFLRNLHAKIAHKDLALLLN